MATDYLLFVHGVGIREMGPARYADPLFQRIKASLNTKNLGGERDLKKIAVYWGGMTEPQEERLLAEYQASPLWQKMWFKQMRQGIFMQFVGDAALYVSRAIGGAIADKIRADVEAVLGPLPQFVSEPDDRLHLVGHSLGTVILFDILFSTRWGEEGDAVPGWESVQALRRLVYGVGPDWKRGIGLGSIVTLGSPLGIFSLLNASAEVAQGGEPNTRDISPGLKQMLEHLVGGPRGRAERLPWRNFMHPADPLASPLTALLAHLVDSKRAYLDVADILVHLPGDCLFAPLKGSDLSLIRAPEAHMSYWRNPTIAKCISRIIRQEVAALEQMQEMITVMQPEQKSS